MSLDKQAVIDKIRAAFAETEFPGEAFLQGSTEGDEPAEEVGPFRSQKDWQAVEAALLDRHANALSFFSEAGFRFFMPAYLVADLNDQLNVADPLFHLTHGFFDFSVDAPFGNRVFVIASGGSTLLNPRRYGAAAFGDHARYRLSVFTREEAGAIVAYLEFRRDRDPVCPEKPRIDAALESYWLERARTAPTAEALRRHLAGQRDYFEAIQASARESGG